MWKRGPLPPETYHWGGVVLVGEESTGFFFADFCGNHVTLEDKRVILADQIELYCNCLELPPVVKGKAIGAIGDLCGCGHNRHLPYPCTYTGCKCGHKIHK